MTDVTQDPVVFARKALGVEVFGYQEALRTTKRTISGVGGRRTGKSLITQVKAINTAMSKRNAQIIATSANESSAKRWLAETADLILASPLARQATVDIEGGKITFKNGSEILALPPTASALRGHGRKVHGVVIDEASLCPPTLWSDLRFILLDNAAEGAWSIQVGPPLAGPEHFARKTWQAGMQGDPDIYSFAWSTLDNPKLPQDLVRRELDRLNSIEAEAEVHGRWLTDGLQLFSHTLLESITADIEVPAIRALHGPARPIIAADFGLSYDQSAMVALYRLPVRGLNADWGHKPVFAVLPYTWPAGTMLNRVVDEIVSCPAPANCYALETNGASGMPSQEVQRRIAQRPVRHGDKRVWYVNATTNARKIAGYATLRWLAENQQLLLPRDPVLLRQLAGLKIEMAGRLPKIEAEDAAVHDDIADALMLATLTYPVGNSMRTRLAYLAGDTAAEDSPHESLDEAIVTTGAGLRTYRRPILQSIADNRLTYPHGAQPAQRHDAFADLRQEAAALS